MKYVIVLIGLALLYGCYSNQARWAAFADKNQCVATGRKKELLAGSIYKIPQRRVVFEFQCGDQKVWSDLGNYTRYNEWLEL
ncbi:hypothetical protein HOT57_gp90 [Pseudomonas phage phCDa]|uniref:Lipoprotein n=1 Tax=Pseudomonas phage phCDa TaxID=2268587 RepID=A0A2Z5H985_9CAUD|nr:hypothetical protein HOT57_gp90 [Pseudomonas phage phCDa]AXC36534.1 hypothetical protein phCDa_90 [Pseudomonas phage phCDa]